MTVPSTSGQPLPCPRADQQCTTTSALKVRKLSWKYGSQQPPGRTSANQEVVLDAEKVLTTKQDPAIRRSQSVSMPVGSNQKTRRVFARSHSFRSPPPELGNSSSSFKAYWGKEIGERNQRSFKEPCWTGGEGIVSYGETTETFGRTWDNCSKSFKAPTDNGGLLKSKSFKCPPDTIGNCTKSFKEPRGNFRSQCSADEAYNDVLFPLRSKQGL